MSELFDWLSDSLGLDGETFASLLLAAVVGMLLSFAVCTAFIVLMPADYFSLRRHPPASRTGLRGSLAFLVRNGVGLLLLVLGLVLAIPGIPFPGMVLALVGFSIMNFPAKRDVQRRLLKRPAIQGRINAVRKKFGKPPILLGC